MKNTPEQTTFWHEKLDTYQRALAFVSRSGDLLSGAAPRVPATDHLNRAGESILENLAGGNSSNSRRAKRHSFGVAYGSALECAACIDIYHCLKLIPQGTWHEEKSELRRIVQMIFGLIRSQQMEVREPEAQWGAIEKNDVGVFFDHENLDVYRLSLTFVAWTDSMVEQYGLPKPRAGRLDELGTSTVLNIAEGNGRIALSDRQPFLRTARASALKCAVAIDLSMARKEFPCDAADEGKHMLARISHMLFGLQDYCEDQ